MIQSLWNLILATLHSTWNLFSALFVFIFEMLSILHFEYPRLEGLIVGVLLAWLLSRKDSNLVVKAISYPLKLIIDILDLVWDKGIGAVSEFINIGKNKAAQGVLWCWSKVKNGYRYLMKKLNIIKDDLEK